MQERAEYPYALLVVEYEQLHEEINNRSRLQSNLVIAALAVLGAGVSAFTTFPDALAGVAAVISILWLFWSDHDKHIASIAAYLERKVTPRLKEATGGYTWEVFFRDLNRGGDFAARQLSEDGSLPDSGPNATWAQKIPPDEGVIPEHRLLFFYVPAALLIVYGASIVHSVQAPPIKAADRDELPLPFKIVALVICLCLLGWSYYRQRQRKKRRDFIEKLITGQE